MSETPAERAQRDPYFAGMREAIHVVQRAVVPLGGSSPWNDGYTTALNKAVGALLAACAMVPEPPIAVPKMVALVDWFDTFEQPLQLARDYIENMPAGAVTPRDAAQIEKAVETVAKALIQRWKSFSEEEPCSCGSGRTHHDCVGIDHD